MEPSSDRSRMPNARVIGLVYLSYALVSFIADFFVKRVVVADPATTVTNLLAHEATYRVGLAITLLGNVMYITVTALFYRLLKPVSRTLSLLMALFSLTGCITQIVAGLFLLTPLVVLRDAQLLGAFKI